MCKTKKISLELSEEVYGKLVEMQGDVNADSMAEVFRRALALYSLCLKRGREGYGVHLKKGDEDILVEFL